MSLETNEIWNILKITSNTYAWDVKKKHWWKTFQFREAWGEKYIQCTSEVCIFILSMTWSCLLPAHHKKMATTHRPDFMKIFFISGWFSAITWHTEGRAESNLKEQLSLRDMPAYIRHSVRIRAVMKIFSCIVNFLWTLNLLQNCSAL